MKKRYQIDQQRAVQQFRRLAAEQNPNIQMILPLANTNTDPNTRMENFAGTTFSKVLTGTAVSELRPASDHQKTGARCADSSRAGYLGSRLHCDHRAICTRVQASQPRSSSSRDERRAWVKWAELPRKPAQNPTFVVFHAQNRGLRSVPSRASNARVKEPAAVESWRPCLLALLMEVPHFTTLRTVGTI